MVDTRTNIQDLLFLKLGGSLITDKGRPSTARIDVIKRIAGEIKTFRMSNPQTHLVLGHGSGSFAHVPAKEYRTRAGVSSQKDWRGFIQVWYAAARLNHIVREVLVEFGLPAMVFPPSAIVTTSNRNIKNWDLSPISSSLKANLLPVVYGDVVFDDVIGGTILSTEDLFIHLAYEMHPGRILLAGIEPGVWVDYPQRSRIAPAITPSIFEELNQVIMGSQAVDVTGGMASKVEQNLDLIKQLPGLEVIIFSGETPGAVEQALKGKTPGTVIKS